MSSPSRGPPSGIRPPTGKTNTPRRREEQCGAKLVRNQLPTVSILGIRPVPSRLQPPRRFQPHGVFPMRSLSLLVAIAAVSSHLGWAAPGHRASAPRPTPPASFWLSGRLQPRDQRFPTLPRVKPGWMESGDASMRLSGRSDHRWQILLPGPLGDGAAFSSPAARGDRRGRPDLSDIPQSHARAGPGGGSRPDQPLVVELEIARFAASGARGRGPRRTGGRGHHRRGRRWQVIAGSIASGLMRDVIVCCHPATTTPQRRPALPGPLPAGRPNVFDHSPPTPGEWGADETADHPHTRARSSPSSSWDPALAPRGFSEYMPSPVRRGAGARVDARATHTCTGWCGRSSRAVERASGPTRTAAASVARRLGALVALEPHSSIR